MQLRQQWWSSKQGILLTRIAWRSKLQINEYCSSQTMTTNNGEETISVSVSVPVSVSVFSISSHLISSIHVSPFIAAKIAAVRHITQASNFYAKPKLWGPFCRVQFSLISDIFIFRAYHQTTNKKREEKMENHAAAGSWTSLGIHRAVYV
jgi:hypothetical protein